MARSHLIVEGTVIRSEVHAVGTPRSVRRDPTRHVAPSTPDRSENVGETDAEPERRSLPVEGGWRLETEVTLAVDRAVLGSAEPTLTLRLAGGTDGVTRMHVFGIPTFELGKRYLLFLHPDHPRTASPVVGVDRGYFHVVPDPTSGTPTLLDADGNVVIGVEDDHVIVRRDHGSALNGPRLGPPPRRGSGDTRVTPQVERYWRSQEPPLSVDAFVAAVVARWEPRP